MKRLILPAVAVLLLAACGGKSNPAAPEPSPEPSATPAPQGHMLVTMAFSQGGQPATQKGVACGADFKAELTNRCFDADDHPETCPFIPYADIQQTAGFQAHCTIFMSSTERYGILFCEAPANDAQFKGCLKDWDGNDVPGGCVTSGIAVGC